MTYRLTTKDDIIDCYDTSDSVVIARKLRPVAERLLAEREAYKRVAIKFSQDAKVKMEDGNLIVPMWVYLEGSVDAEAQRILGKEGE